MYCCGPHYSGITEAVLLTSFHSCPHISSRYKSSVSQMADRLQGSCRIYPVSPRKLVVEQEIRSIFPRSLSRCYIFWGNITKLCFPTCSYISCRYKSRASVSSSILVGGGIRLETPASSYQKSLMVHRSGSGHKAWSGSFFFSLNLKKKKKFGLNKQTNKKLSLILKTY